MNKQRALKIMQTTKKTYNLIGEEFSDTRDRVWPEMEILVKKYMKPGDKVLDVGCGNGRLLDILPKVDYLGIDNSKILLEILKPKKINFKLLDILELDKLKKKSFDAIFMFASFNHLPNKELRLKVLRDVGKLLKSDGLVIMTNWNLWQFGAKKSIWKYNIKKGKVLFKDVITLWQSRDGKKRGELYYRGLSTGELSRLFNKAGFKLIENHYSLNGEKVSWRRARNIVTVAKHQ